MPALTLIGAKATLRKSIYDLFTSSTPIHPSPFVQTSTYYHHQYRLTPTTPYQSPATNTFYPSLRHITTIMPSKYVQLCLLGPFLLVPLAANTILQQRRGLVHASHHLVTSPSAFHNTSSCRYPRHTTSVFRHGQVIEERHLDSLIYRYMAFCDGDVQTSTR